jgi:DNA-binding response OmpR family regulator
MHILITDRDEMVSDRLASRLAEMGHSVHCESNKGAIVDYLQDEETASIDMVLADPSPMKGPGALVMNIKRSSVLHPYIFWMSEDEPDLKEVLQSGCNDVLVKPVSRENLAKKIENAIHLRQYADLLADMSEDFPSAGGVIAKSAFNQLFLSAIERSGRYNELSYVMNIRMKNYRDILGLDGAHAANYSVSKMAAHIVYLRRQSDIIGQIRPNEYSILFLRVDEETEAIDAIKRFSIALQESPDIVSDNNEPVVIEMELLHLPSGKQAYHQQFELTRD